MIDSRHDAAKDQQNRALVVSALKVYGGRLSTLDYFDKEINSTTISRHDMSTEALTLVRRVIDAVNAVQKAEDFPGISKVKAELAVMMSALDKQTLPERRFRNPGLARLVTDSWPLHADVTVAVLEAEQAYLELP